MSSDTTPNSGHGLAAKGLLERNKPFAVALGASLAFHLMMVTVFAVVIRFPLEYMDYYPVYLMPQTAPAIPSAQIAEPATQTTEGQVPGLLLRKPTADGLLETALPLPTIEVPRLQLSSTAPASPARENLQIPADFGYLFEEKQLDSWARFTGEMQGLGSALSKLTFGRLLGGEKTAIAEEDKPVRVSMPAPGVCIYVKWFGRPKDRRLLFAPPNRTFWGLEASQLDVPISVPFAVNAEGTVTEVQAPVEDDAGVAASAAEVLKRYRFAPCEDGQPQIQHGTLIIAAESSAP